MNQQDFLKYYSKQSNITNPKGFAHFFDDLPLSVPKLVSVVQNVVIDKDLLGLYGKEITNSQKGDCDTRYVEKILTKLVVKNNQSLVETRKIEEKFVGSCRDYAVMLCSMLRHLGIPARVRCGFDTYFNIKSDFYDDHWTCEYWNNPTKQWILVDANIDQIVKEKYRITINTLDISRDKFIVAGKAWQMCRNGEADPNKFGVSSIDIKGLWFVRGSIIRDLAALNKAEVLPWDYWGIADKASEDFPKEDLIFLDKVAKVTVKDDTTKTFRFAYEDERAKITPIIKSYSPFFGLQKVKLTDDYVRP